jgi:hypothetical protein
VIIVIRHPLRYGFWSFRLLRPELE